jgi:hypothetical protein
MRSAGPWLLVLVVAVAAFWLWRGDASPRGIAVPETDSDSETERPQAPLLESRAEPTAAGDATSTEATATDAAVPPPLPTPAEKGRYTITGTVQRRGTDEIVAGGTIVARYGGFHGVTFIGAEVRPVQQPPVQWSAEVDSGGRFTMMIAGAPPPSISDFTYLGTGLQVFRWIILGKEDQPYTDATPGGTNTIRVTVEDAFRIQGEVVDPDGRPREGTVVSFGTFHRMGTQREIRPHRVVTGTDGRFEAGPFPTTSPEGLEGRSFFLHLSFEQPGYAMKRLDPWKIPAAERDRVRVVLDPGATLGGVLLDPAGQALPGVVIDFEVGKDWNTRRAVRTDAAGLWQVERVQRGTVHVRALAFAYGCKVSRDLEVRGDDLRMELVAERIPRPDPRKIKQVVGLSLVDVNDEMRKAYELPDEVNVLILAADETHARLGIGTVEPGYGLWMVGDTSVKDVEEAVARLLTLSENSAAVQAGLSTTVRVVYTFANERMRGTNTQHLRLNEEQRTDLGRLQDELRR